MNQRWGICRSVFGWCLVDACADGLFREVDFQMVDDTGVALVAGKSGGLIRLGIPVLELVLQRDKRDLIRFFGMLLVLLCQSIALVQYTTSFSHLFVTFCSSSLARVHQICRRSQAVQNISRLPLSLDSLLINRSFGNLYLSKLST